MRLRTFLIGCGIVLLVVVLVSGCGLVLVAGSLPSGERPDVDFLGPEISADRAAVVPELEAQLDEVESRFGAEHVGPQWRIDRCEAGFDDFTRTDRYAYSCRMAIAQLMPVRKPFVPNASLLGEALFEGDCPDGTDTDRALAEPFDHPRQVDGSSGACTPEWLVPAPEIRSWLTRTPTDDELESAEFYVRGSFGSCDPTYLREYCESSEIDVRAAVRAAPPDAAYLAIVVADDSYHSIPWDCPWPASWVRDVCES